MAVLRGRLGSGVDVKNSFRMYLKEFKQSALGHALMDGEVPPEMERLGLGEVAGGVREVLERVQVAAQSSLALTRDMGENVAVASRHGHLGAGIRQDGTVE